MRTRRILLGVLLSGLLPVAASGAESSARIERVEKGLRPPVLVVGDAPWTLDERLKKFAVPGLSIAVIQDGRIVWAKGYGLADVDANKPVTAATLFQAGSISKPVAAMGALTLVEDGKLALDRDINASLKSWKVPSNAFTQKTPVTLEELLSHTAGLTVHGFPGYAAGAPVPTVVQVLDGTPPANTAPVRVDLAPGTQYRYSGGGYTVAQLAMTDVTGEAFPKFMAEEVLRPVGMTASTYEQPLAEARVPEAAAGYRDGGKPVEGKRHVYPEMAAAGLWTTPSDLARFAIAVQKMLRGEKGPLSKTMAQNMVRPRKDGYGLGFAIEDKGGTTYFTHGGADEGFQALLYASVDRGYGAALMTNSDAGFRVMPEVLRAIAAEYNWEGFQKEPIALAKLSPEELALFAGRYKLDSDTLFVVTPQGPGLEVKETLGQSFTLLPVSRDAFVRRDEETRYTFGRRADGGAELRIDAEKLQTAPRVDKNTRVPSEDLEAGRVDEALAGYSKLKAANPSDPVVAEARFNGMGYGYLQRGETAKAIAVFRLNTELYPESANTYDSLAEATEASGDKAAAVALYKKALEVAGQGKGSTAAGAGSDESVWAHAKARLEALGAQP
jgi:CubicO group peptidase (beta-lactamase class C family)